MPDRFTLINDDVRENCIRAIRNAPEKSRVVISEARRSTEQSDKMWAMLGDVAKAEPEGRQWTKETWRDAFMHALGHQVQFAMALDNSGPFPIGFRSSKLSVAQMSDLITIIYEYGDRHGVKWAEAIKGGWRGQI